MIENQVFGGHWRLALAGAAALGIALMGMAVSSSQGVDQIGETVEVPDSTVKHAPEPVPPILALAKDCLAQCSGSSIKWTQRTELPLPYEFADLLKKPSFKAAFDALVASLPADFIGLAHLKDNDRQDLPLEGYAKAVIITPNGRQLQLYVNVGYPERQWVNSEEFRRPPGIMWIVVDPKSGEIAGIFNGPSTLSDFRFVGSTELIGPMMALMVADEFDSLKLKDLGFPEDAPNLTLPLSGENLTSASARLSYLGEHFKDGMITGTETLSDIKERQDEAAGQYWYSPNSEFTLCRRTGGPAEKLDEFVGFTDKPTTQDFYDANGELTKVEVINSEAFGRERVWTFYKRRSDCEREQVNRTSDLADRYRQ